MLAAVSDVEGYKEEYIRLYEAYLTALEEMVDDASHFQDCSRLHTEFVFWLKDRGLILTDDNHNVLFRKGMVVFR